MMPLTMRILPSFLFFAIFFLTTSPSSSLSSPESKGVDYWCNRTPHPGPCQYYFGRGYLNRAAPANEAEFYNLFLQLAYDLTFRAQGYLKRQALTCNSEPEKLAWLDCLNLYDNTLILLNQTLYPPPASPAGVSAADSQTWLSASLTNLETCSKGFRDVNASASVIEPVAGYNVSDIISNCLAINRPAMQADAMREEHETSGWMMMIGKRRKLLQLRALANLVVAQDGSGNFRNIQAALNAAAAKMRKGKYSRFVIHVKTGVYNEIVQITKNLNNVTMIGDGIGKTVITGRRSVTNGFTTLSSATFSVFGDGFEASGISFRNTFGPGSQAVALLSASDRSSFYRCSIEGYQDTLFVYTQRQFYRECDIYGTIDFIFGNAAVVFQRCNIYARLPRHGEANVITAQGRSDANQNTGIVFQFSIIRPAPDLAPKRQTVKSYLGRPWMIYSRTVYMQSYIDSFIDPAGWLPYDGQYALNTLYYAEYGNTGAGSMLSRRVKWPGFHPIRKASIVRPFTVGRFIAGRTWLPSTGIPFDPTL